VYHTAWAARILAERRPARHIDISSSLYFSALVSAFLPVDFYDFRPAALNLSGLNTARGDLMKLPFSDRSVGSLSCMHVVEHVGLGRYGDPLDPDGDLKAMAELERVLMPGGDLLFVVPCGRPRVCFNAHRVYAYKQIRDAFASLTLLRFALIPDNANAEGMIDPATESAVDAQEYGCGCFWFRRSIGDVK
jgi:SAM-dependent methyltransferase